MTDQETTPSEAIPETDAPPLAAPPAPPQVAQEADPRYALPPAPRQNPPQARVPFVAALCSLFPGLGNVYNGLYTRGITFFVICFGLIGIAGSAQVEARAIFVFAAIFVWLFNIFDAYRQATFINYGYVPDQLPARPYSPASASGGLTLGVAIFMISLYFFLHNRFDFDLSFIFDNIDVMGMALGAYLISRRVREWKKAKAESDDTPDGLEAI